MRDAFAVLGLVCVGAFLVALMVVFSVGGCSSEGRVVASSAPAADSISTGVYRDIVKIRDCEYVRLTVIGGVNAIHAGDCRNPIHDRR